MIKYIKNKKGFTLVEIMIVVSIYGILSSGISTSLLVAQQKAQDVSIKATLNNIRTGAELIYINEIPNSYLPVCLGSPVDLAMQKLQDQNSNIIGDYQCLSDTNTWMSIFPLSDGTYWCSDSTGYVGTVEGFTERAAEEDVNCITANEVASEEQEAEPPFEPEGGNTAPELTLLGDTTLDVWHPGNNPFNGNSPNKYVEPGYTAIDAQEGDLYEQVLVQGPNVISYNKNFKWNKKKCPHTVYELLYSITDSGNLSDGPDTRTVNHYKCNN